MSSSLDFLSRSDEAAHPSVSAITPPSSRGFRWPAWLVPLAILGGFAALFLTLYRDRLLPAVKVEVAHVITTTDALSQAEPSPANKQEEVLLFQASGWLEPDPYAVKASSLIDGVIAEVLVLEGQSVKKGEVIATLVNDDARLKLAAAEGRHRMLNAERNAHVAAVKAATSKQDSAKAEILAAETLVTEAKDELERFESLQSGAISDSTITNARLRYQREKANLGATKARVDEQGAEISRLEATIATKDEEIRLAEVMIAQEKLFLDRTRILAPISGRILRLMAAPGEKKMLAMDHPDSSTIAILYDPAKLQVRVDVPLADAARLKIGLNTRIHCSLLPDQAFEGEVTRITGEADLQRNTLQAKVLVKAPSDLLRPEMLCRVEFHGTPANAEHSLSANDSESLNLWIPTEGLKDGNTVWLYNPDSGRTSRRSVTSGTEMREGYTRIKEGLRPGEQVIISAQNLREGQRVTPHFPQP